MSNLADIRPKPVKVMLDKERTLLFDLNTYAEIELEYGSVEKALDDLQKGKINALRVILWAALHQEDESLTIKDAGKLFTLADLQRISKLLNEAISQSMPTVENPSKNAENPPQE